MSRFICWRWRCVSSGTPSSEGNSAAVGGCVTPAGQPLPTAVFAVGSRTYGTDAPVQSAP